MKPMLAKKYQDQKHKLSWPCFVQPKLNGVRGIYRAGIMASRDEHPWEPSVVKHITDLLQNLSINVILDGEFYRHGWSLQRINSAISINRKEPSNATPDIEYHVFDCVFVKELELPFSERFKKLQELLPAYSTAVRLVPTQRVHHEMEADEIYRIYKELEYEGMMYRDDVAYGLEQLCTNKENRWPILLKRKDWLDEDCLIIDVQEGNGKYEGMVGALVCVFSNGVTFTVGSGLSDLQRDEFMDHPPNGLTAKIRYEMLSDDGVPLKPTVECINE